MSGQRVVVVQCHDELAAEMERSTRAPDRLEVLP